MINSTLSSEIYQKALACGFDDCGIIPHSDIKLDLFEQRLEERKRRVPQSKAFYQWMECYSKVGQIYPWAKSIVVCTTWLGKYRYPESLRGKYAKALRVLTFE